MQMRGRVTDYFTYEFQICDGFTLRASAVTLPWDDRVNIVGSAFVVFDRMVSVSGMLFGWCML